MSQPHYQVVHNVTLPLNDVTRHLAENLHLRWSYGLMYVDQFADEDERAISVIYGIHMPGDKTMFGLRIFLSEPKSNNWRSTRIEIQIWHMQTQGWPLVDSQGQAVMETDPRQTHAQRLRKIAQDVVEFCEAPHGAGSGIFDLIRSVFVNTIKRRKYKRSVE